MDENMEENQDFPIVKVGKSTRARGADLLFTGAVTFGAAIIISQIAPLGLIAYGAYRLLLRKSKKEGALFIAGGIGLFMLVFGLPFLVRLPMIIGVGMMVIGTVMIFKKQKKVEE